MTEALPILIYGILALGCLAAGATGGDSWTLTPEAKELMSHGHSAEFGLFTAPDEDLPRLRSYVAANWKPLLEHIEEVPISESGRKEIAYVIGQAAEILPAEDYMRFLDSYLEAYERGQIPELALYSQLWGRERKRFFLQVNATSPLVKSLLARVRSRIPAESEIHATLDQIAAGEVGMDMFLNEDYSPRTIETLPGVTLPDFAPEGGRRRGEVDGAEVGGLGPVSPEEGGADGMHGTGRRWVIFAALAALVAGGIAVWRSGLRGREKAGA